MMCCRSILIAVFLGAPAFPALAERDRFTHGFFLEKKPLETALGKSSEISPDEPEFTAEAPQADAVSLDDSGAPETPETSKTPEAATSLAAPADESEPARLVAAVTTPVAAEPTASPSTPAAKPISPPIPQPKASQPVEPRSQPPRPAPSATSLAAPSKPNGFSSKPGAAGAAATAAPASTSTPSGSSVSELAKQTQNPVADLISLPFQNNFGFGYGASDDVQWVLNIQPVIPFHLSEDWNLITRTILPVISEPSIAPGIDSEFGIGDLDTTLFLSPAHSRSLTLGFGPVFTFPTASDDVLGTGKWLLGPSLVLVYSRGDVVAGGLVNNQWSVGGDSDRPDVNTGLVQPFLNYNLAHGWYLVTAPIITVDWNAEDDRWTVPVGGGIGRVLHVGRQPVNIQGQAFYNVERPDLGPDWSARLQVQLLFPKG